MNHLGDLGALGNDAGLSFGLTQFSILKENMLRLNAQLFGHRYLMDTIIPGGVTTNISSKDIKQLSTEIEILKASVSKLRQIYADHQGLQDRFVTTGVVTEGLAKQLCLLGLTARASGLGLDWRKQFPGAPLDTLGINISSESAGDVAARVSVRFNEVAESLRLIELMLDKLPEGHIHAPLPKLININIGFGCVEGWRGPVFFAVCNRDENHIRWSHYHDPSWQNWPALEYAVLGNIVPDFPVINKSFNHSYSGHDS